MKMGTAESMPSVMACTDQEKPQTVRLAAKSNLPCSYRQNGDNQNKSQALASIALVCAGWSDTLVVIFAQPCS